jgi:hypothetical protein
MISSQFVQRPQEEKLLRQQYANGRAVECVMPPGSCFR